MKIITEVWCVNPDAIEKNKQIGTTVHDEDNRWMPYGFDLRDVRNFKVSGDTADGFINLGEATSVTFQNGECVTIRMEFKELARFWLWLDNIPGGDLYGLSSKELTDLGVMKYLYKNG